MSLSSLISFLMANLSYKNIFILMMLESSLIPVPSELVIIPAGFLMASGLLSWYGILLSSLLGGLVGSLFSYGIALYLGRKSVEKLVEKYGIFLLITKEHLAKTEKYFATHGSLTIFVGRLLPVVRHLISLPAGFSKMPLTKFIVYTLLGAGVWAIVLMSLGYLVGVNQSLISQYLNIITFGLIALSILIIIIYLLIRKKK